jgi:tetratricopeptide (TPR) repeat protein
MLALIPLLAQPRSLAQRPLCGLAALILGTLALPSPAGAAPHPILWALSLDDAAIAQLDHATAMTAAEWLWVWPQYAQRPVTGNTEQYLRALRRAQAMFRREIARAPGEAAAYWKLARGNYDIGELLPETATTERTALYQEMIAVTERCVREVDPNDAACWHFLATGKGRLSTTQGVISSLRRAKEVESAWLTAYNLNSTYTELNGDPLQNNIRYGLGVFYRMVPDMWIVQLLAGTRGDVAKSVRYFREAVQVQPYRLELLKELAASLLCYGYDRDDPKATEEGMTLLRRVQTGEFTGRDPRATDEIDLRHVADLLREPARACGYSRDGYEDARKEAERAR